MGIFDKIFKRNKEQEVAKETLDAGLEKTKKGFFGNLTKAIAGKSKVDEEVLDALEEALVTADVGVKTTVEIIDRIEARVAADKYLGTAELNQLLQEEMMNILTEAPSQEYQNFDLPADYKPHVMLVVGVNGVGKTTTIGKLAYNFKKAGKTVVLGAADTFRAAAVEQLKIWAKRVDVDIVEKGMDADPASVAFDTVKSGMAKGADVIIIDTAGRLHNKVHLMDELNKIKRVIQKSIPEAPHDVMLVLDGSTGQNALEQAKQFTAATDVKSLAITKLDGTAKGGVVLAIAHQFNIPVKYIGVGEQMTDLQVFNKHEFVDSIFNLENA
jgi:fused signal recognition particle receptor